MSRKQERKEPINIMKEDGDDRERFDNEYEMKGILPRVRSLKNVINEDYTLAKLKKEEKEFLTENLINAGFAKLLIDRYWQRGHVYKWNDEKKDWVRNEDGTFKKMPLDEETIKKMVKMSNDLFQTFMTKPHMIAILSRNDVDNFMVKLLGKHPEEEGKDVEYDKDDKSTMQKIGEFLKGKGSEDEDGD